MYFKQYSFHQVNIYLNITQHKYNIFKYFFSGSTVFYSCHHWRLRFISCIFQKKKKEKIFQTKPLKSKETLGWMIQNQSILASWLRFIWNNWHAALIQKIEQTSFAWRHLDSLYHIDISIASWLGSNIANSTPNQLSKFRKKDIVKAKTSTLIKSHYVDISIASWLG